MGFLTWWRSIDGLMRKVVGASIIVLALLVVMLTVSYCGEARANKRAAKEREVAAAQAAIGADAAVITADQVQSEADNAQTTARNREDILNAPDANETAGDAGSRGLRALCRRVSYRDSPRCVELRRADRADAAD